MVHAVTSRGPRFPEQSSRLNCLDLRVPRFAAVRHQDSGTGGQVSVQDVYSSSAVAGLAKPELHETPASLSQDERRLAATYEQAGIGIAEIDAAGKLLRVNGHLCNLLGLEPEALLGRSVFDLTHPEDEAKDRAQYARQVSGETDGYSLEKRFRRNDGSYLWTSITSRSVKDDEGRFLYAVCVQQDISDRKRAEDAVWRHDQERSALHQLTARLQFAAEPEHIYAAAMDAMYWALQCHRASVLLFDAAGVMRFVASRGLSEPYCKAVEGHSPWSRDTTDPQPVCIDDIAAADLPAELKATVAREGIGALAFVPLQEGGRLFGKFMIYYDAPHAFTKDNVALAVTIARHVSFSLERLRTQRAALQLAAIVESSEDAIVSKDLNGVVSTWNQGAEKLFGYTAEEAIGQPITALVIPQDRLNEEPEILQRIRRGERVEHFETVRRRKDGGLIDISLTISPIRDPQGRIIGASKIARDVTEKRFAERMLRDSERRLQDLLSAIPAAIYTTDAQGHITYYNEAAVEFAGRRPVLGSDQWCVTGKLFLPDGTPLPHDQCPMAVALKEGRAVRGVEAVAERPDGTRVPFIPYPTPLLDADGNVTGAINMLVDISQRKEAETQQRILLNELNHRVKNNMQMLQSLLSNSIRQTKSDEARRVLQEAAGRLAAMAAAQRALYSNGGAVRFDAREFVRSVCATAEQTFPTRTRISYRADEIELGNDVAMPLALILNELLTNAVKYGTNGKESIEGGSIRVGLTRRQDRCVLSVEDDGPGFDLEETRQRASGLFLIQGLARQLDGQFMVSKSPTCCSVEFGQGLSS
jgi:PAS domain S-box-containing protein